MSYNTLKVSSKTPNQDGDVALNLADVASVTTPTTNQVLGFDGTNWGNKDANWVKSFELGMRSTRANSTVNYNSNIVLTWSRPPVGEQRWVYWHRNTGYQFTNFVANSNNDAELITHDISGSTTRIYYKLKINNAGIYRLFFKFALNDVYGSDSDAMEIQWANGDASVTYGARVRIKKPTMKQVPCIGVIEANGGEEIGLYKHALYGTPKQPLRAFREYLMIIEKLE